MKGNHQLTVMIPVFDKEGRKVGEKEVATYHGLLAKAHDEGLRRIATEIVQTPSPANGETAIVRATVETNKGTFAGIGDASPANVNRRVGVHLMRMAETRAKARALRDAVNIGVVALDELGELVEEDASPPVVAAVAATLVTANSPSPESAPPPVPPTTVPVRGDFQVMSDAQRRMLFRLAGHRGVKPEEAQGWLEQYLKVPALTQVSRAEASRAIDGLQTRPNGNGNGNGVDHGAQP